MAPPAESKTKPRSSVSSSLFQASVAAKAPTDKARRKAALANLSVNGNHDTNKSPAGRKRPQLKKPAPRPLHVGSAFAAVDSCPRSPAAGKIAKPLPSAGTRAHASPFQGRRRGQEAAVTQAQSAPEDSENIAEQPTIDTWANDPASEPSEEEESPSQDLAPSASQDSAETSSSEEDNDDWGLWGEVQKQKEETSADERLVDAENILSDLSDTLSLSYEDPKNAAGHEFRDIAQNITSCLAKSGGISDELKKHLSQVYTDDDDVHTSFADALTDLQDKMSKLKSRMASLRARSTELVKVEKEAKQAMLAKLGRLGLEQEKEIIGMKKDNGAAVTKFNTDIVEALNDKAEKKEMQKRLAMFLAS